MNTDTPETDGEWNRLACQDHPEFERNLADFARKLERGRDEARQAFVIATDQMVIAQGKVRKAERERDEAREERDKLAEAIEANHNGTLMLEQMIYAAREQRDEMKIYADKLAEGLPDGMLPKDVEVLREANLGLAMELAEARGALASRLELYQFQNQLLKKRSKDKWAAIDQRDRLAEALRSIKNELGVPQPEYPAPVANAVKIADEALNQLNL